MTPIARSTSTSRAPSAPSARTSSTASSSTPAPSPRSRRCFAALGDEQPRAVLLTHIHLDHAGAAGALVQRWPELEVWVHRNGAKHVIDPSRLVASATRIYGDAMERLWGKIVPVAQENVRILDDDGTARRLPLGLDARPRDPPRRLPARGERHRLHRRRRGRAHRRRPGLPADAAARHRHRGLAPLDRPGRLPGSRARWRSPTSARSRDVAPHLASLHAELDRWAQVARRTDAAGFESEIRAALAAGPEEASYLKAMPPDTLYGGLARYWQKRDTASST